VPGHRSGCFLGIASQQGLDNGEVFVGFLGQSAKVISSPLVLPGRIAKRPKQNLQAVDFRGQELVAARIDDQVVQTAIDSSGPEYEALPGQRFYGHQPLEVSLQCPQISQSYSTACQPGRLAFQNLADLANLFYLVGCHLADYGAAVWQQVNNADSSQGDQRFANRRMANGKSLGQFLSYQVFSRAKAAPKHFC
jgi:hypothetical protein